MTHLIIIPVGQTDWRAHGRLTGDTNLPLNETGKQQAAADAEALAGQKPVLIRCGPEQAEKETATIIADRLELKVKSVKELREMDLGHWEGLTLDDFRERFPKVYKQWRADPTSVTPPEGESINQVADRLVKGLDKITKDYPDQAVAVVIGHFAYAILRCRLQDGSFEQFWDHVEGEDRWQLIELTKPVTPTERTAPVEPIEETPPADPKAEQRSPSSRG